MLITGYTASSHPDYVVVKYAAADGATLWQGSFGVNGGDYPSDMAIDALGDVYVTGTGIDFIDKYSTIKLRGSDGALVWQAYDAVANDHSARAIAVDDQGGVYVTGTADPEGNHSNFNDDIFTVKRSAASGALLWTHRYGAPCVGCYDVGGDVIVDASGHVFVAGSTSSPPYSSDAILLVLSAATGAETDRGIVDAARGQSVLGRAPAGRRRQRARSAAGSATATPASWTSLSPGTGRSPPGAALPCGPKLSPCAGMDAPVARRDPPLDGQPRRASSAAATRKSAPTASASSSKSKRGLWCGWSRPRAAFDEPTNTKHPGVRSK